MKRKPIVPILAFLLLSGPAVVKAQNKPPLRPGWPVTLSGAGAVRASHPAVGDLDRDGVQEIVVGTQSGRVYVLRANGTVAAGWPITMPAEIGASPAIGDLDGDGFLEVVVACGSTFDPNGPGEVRAYRRNGTILWSFFPADENGDGRPDPVVSTPAIGDVDGDGASEVAFGSYDFNLYLLRGATGALVPGFPPNPSGLGHGLRDSIWSSPALADLDADGKLEIIIGADTHVEGPPINSPAGGAIHVFRSNGTEMPGFPRYVDQTIMSSPAIADLDGDGSLDIVVGGGVFYTGAVGRRVYAWRRDGTPLPGWPVVTNGQVYSSPALADLTGDGKPEVIVSDEPSDGTGPFLYAFRGNGALHFKIQPKSFFSVTPYIGSPSVADVTGDGKPDILVAVNTEITVIGANGEHLTDPGPPSAGDPRVSYYTNTAIISGAVVTDLDNDGILDVVAASGEPFPTPTAAAVYVWNPAPVGPLPWPMFRKELQRRGAPIPGPSGLFTVAPCRVVDTRLSGGPLSAGSERIFTVGGRCSVPYTARSVALNVTVVQPSTGGYLVAYASDSARPSSSTINFRAGQTKANIAVLPLSPEGQLTVFSGIGFGSSHLIIDVVGYLQ
jgi:VCBS repeat protein